MIHHGGYKVLCHVVDGRVAELALRTAGGNVSVLDCGYEPAGSRDAVTNSSGLHLRFGGDPDGRITSWTDRNGSSFHYGYDLAGRVTTTTGPDGMLSAHLRSSGEDT
ncbi:RHS repeat domain-containing protein [Streptomyces sp. NPDC001770]